MFLRPLQKISMLASFLRARFSPYRVPLFVGWDITSRCNYRCRYCRIPDLDPSAELSAEEVLFGIDQLYKLGAKRIHFSGGEALLRDDLGKILMASKNRRISTTVTTNGALFKARLTDLRNADFVKISFDGPREVHDKLRQKGSFEQVMEAIELAKKNNMKISFNTTLCAENIACIDYVLGVAQQYEVPVKFQLVNEYLAGVNKNMASLGLTAEQRRTTAKTLIDRKRSMRCIINSNAALQYMQNGPARGGIACSAGKIYIRISADGHLYPCTMTPIPYGAASYTDSSIKSIFDSLPMRDCPHCRCCTSVLELNLIYSLSRDAIFNAWRRF